jgi:two-component sensor histidine kinase
VRLYEEAAQRAEQLEWTVQETQHRIKNNLQAVSAILDLRLMEETGANSASATALSHALQQIRTIATLNGLISEDARSGRVPLRRLMDTLVPMLTSSGPGAEKQIDITVETEDIRIPNRIASALALTVNELVANAIQHGGEGRDTVAVRITLRQEPQAICLTVADDGPGFPEGYTLQAAKIGLGLAQTLVERDHGGTLTLTNSGGAQVTACIPFTAWQEESQPAARVPSAQNPGEKQAGVSSTGGNIENHFESWQVES